MNENNIQGDQVVGENWIELSDSGTFVCSECENESVPQRNTIDGQVDANIEEISKELADYPTSIIYGICPVCGMEYEFKSIEGKLYLKPSEMLK